MGDQNIIPTFCELEKVISSRIGENGDQYKVFRSQIMSEKYWILKKKIDKTFCEISKLYIDLVLLCYVNSILVLDLSARDLQVPPRFKSPSVIVRNQISKNMKRENFVNIKTLFYGCLYF